MVSSYTTFFFATVSNRLLIQLVTSLVLYQSQLSCYLLDRVRCEVQFSLGLCFCAKVTRPLNNSVAMELSLNFQGFMSACWRRFNLNFRSTNATFPRANNSTVDGWTFGLDDVFTKTKVQG